MWAQAANLPNEDLLAERGVIVSYNNNSFEDDVAISTTVTMAQSV